MDSPRPSTAVAASEPPPTRQEEWRSFVFFAIFMAPALAVAIVGGYGFIVWMYQLFTGHLPTG